MRHDHNSNIKEEIVSMVIDLLQIVHWNLCLESWSVLSMPVLNVGPCFILFMGPHPLHGKKIKVLSSTRTMEQGVMGSHIPSGTVL